MIHQQRSDVSVVIAAYNQEKYIGRCLRSLLHQTFEPSRYEIIVVNDGSRDKTDYALRQFCGSNLPRVKVLDNEKNRGLPAALNRGIREACGKYIIRVDADDFVNQNYIAFMHYYLECNRTVDAVACDYLVVDDDERILRRCSAESEPIACGIMFRKSVLLELGLYDESFRLHEERELRIRFEESYKIDFLKVPMYRYRMHSGNMTSDKLAMGIHMDKLIEKHGKL